MSVDDEIATESEKKKDELPDLTKGMILKLNKLEPKQHFTLPPPRFTEASLVKELEENGIGRPSTYAAILSTIREKKYVELVKRYFRPSELGFIVNDLLVGNFRYIFNVDFTARMEDFLDRIEMDEMLSDDILNRFYRQFKKELDIAAEKMPSIKGEGFPSGHNCPECQKELRIKVGKNGHFLACSGYPDCTYSRDYTRDEKGNIRPVEPEQDIISDKSCDKCGKSMGVKQGRYGKFLACSGYPECKNTYSVNSVEPGMDTGVDCPEKDCPGRLVQKQSKRGKIFYGCNRFPECAYAIWDKPINKECPVCKASFLVEKSTKKRGTYFACITKDCGYTETE
jgi:DNA topoisomerase-1